MAFWSGKTFPFLMAITFGLMLTPIAIAQSKTEQAVALLNNALLCALGPQAEPLVGGASHTVTTQSFAGDTSRFSVNIHEDVRFHRADDHTVLAIDENSNIAANFSNMASVTLIPPKSVSISCKDGRLCFTSSRTTGKTKNVESVAIRLCDADTADNARVAIELLIQSNAVAISPASQKPKSTSSKDVSDDVMTPRLIYTKPQK